MTPQKLSKTGFEKWQDAMSEAQSDAKWDIWDYDIQQAVDEYNRHLSKTPGYRTLDWHLIKAIAWVKTGPHNSEWYFRPLQPGIHGNPGMTLFLSGNQGGELILPQAWKSTLTPDTIKTVPVNNIRAGAGYLLMRMARFEHRAVPGANGRIDEITVKAGDSISKIAKAQGSTVEIIQKLNAPQPVLRPGQKLRYQKAVVRRVITGWRGISSVTLSQYCNDGGDPHYSRKLDYALSLIKRGKLRQAKNSENGRSDSGPSAASDAGKRSSQRTGSALNA